MSIIKPQKEFPLLKRYKKVFPEIEEHTIFAYDGVIYTDQELPKHLIVHETRHLRQQEAMGLEKWVDKYLTDVSFRLQMEVEAYQVQVRSIADREHRNKVRIQSARALSSPLYGSIITMEEALKLLK